MHLNSRSGAGQSFSAFSVWKSIAWLFIGIPWLLWAVIRDCKDYWAQLYKEHEGYDEDKQMTKVQQVVNEKVIKDI